MASGLLRTTAVVLATCVTALADASRAATDLTAHLDEAEKSDPDVMRIGSRVTSVFGTDPAERAAWNAVQLAPAIRADVLLMREDDDARATAAEPANPCETPPVASHLVADATETGLISLRFYDAEGVRVDFFECIGRRARPLGWRRVEGDPSIHPPTTLQDAATWSCDRLVRRFAARATLRDGSLATGAYSVRTVSCAQRLRMSVSRRVEPGAVARIRVVDRWRIGGIRARLCIMPPHAKRECRTLAFPRAVAVASRRFRPTTRGRWRVMLDVRGKRRQTFVAVGGGASARQVTPPTVLATGDSTIQGIDSFLSDELGDAAVVRSDAQPASGVSRTDYWLRHAVSQIKHYRPRVTVMSVGAATDSVPLLTPAGTPAPCCDEPWVLAYTVAFAR